MILAWDCGAGHYFDVLICHHLVLYIFPFLVSTAKLLGELYDNRRSTENRCPHFAYFFCTLCCANPIGPVSHTPPIANEKICENILIATAKGPALPISVTKELHSAYKHRVHVLAV
jgi:hypothetical protein